MRRWYTIGVTMQKDVAVEIDEDVESSSDAIDLAMDELSLDGKVVEAFVADISDSKPIADAYVWDEP